MWVVHHYSKKFQQDFLSSLNLSDVRNLDEWFKKIPDKHIGPHNNKHDLAFINCNGTCLWIKKYNKTVCTNNLLLRKFQAYVFSKRLMKRYKIHRKLFQSGRAVPVPFACIFEYNHSYSLLSGYIISQKLDMTLVQYWDQNKLYPARKTHLLKMVAIAIADLHLYGYFHGDLIWENIMVNDDKVFLIDLDGSRCPPRKHRFKRYIRDIIRFTRLMYKYEKDEITMVAFISLFLSCYSKRVDMDKRNIVIEMCKYLNRAEKRYYKKNMENHVENAKKLNYILHSLI